jgi:hypothetical protein
MESAPDVFADALVEMASRSPPGRSAFPQTSHPARAPRSIARLSREDLLSPGRMMPWRASDDGRRGHHSAKARQGKPVAPAALRSLCEPHLLIVWQPEPIQHSPSIHRDA